MPYLDISEQDARKIYPTAIPELKIILEGTFTKAFFSQDICDRVNSVQDACRELGIDFDNLYDDCNDKYEEAEVAIKTVAEALREGKSPKDCIWYPWFWKKTSTSGFRFLVALFAYTGSYVGARLRVDSEKKATHLGKILLKEYEIYTTGE